jgi:hypothetical protein
MVKILFLILLALSIKADVDLEKSCLDCHKKQQIPSALIYKRYLLKYSTKDRIKDAIYLYLKNPTKENSIMPKPFFLRFPMKKTTNLNDKTLKKAIELYIDKFDIRKKLVVE